MSLKSPPKHYSEDWSIDQTDSWKQLQAHYKTTKNLRLDTLFEQDPKRFKQFSIPFEGHVFDFSKNHITTQTLDLFKDLCQEAQLFERIEALFKGDIVNETEQRPALHCALRSADSTPIYVDGENIMPLINDMQSRIESQSERIRRGRWLGSTGKPVRDVVNIGVGGSDLGPRMVTEAFKYAQTPGTTLHFVSSIDGNETIEILKKLDPETSLFIISSKSFTTSDTLTNAQTVKSWLERGLGSVFDTSAHFIGVSENSEAMSDFGIPAENQLPMWKWVGGRYSVWSAIGLPIAIALGMDQFREFLAGAQWADHHYRTAPVETNIPIILAMLGILYNSIGNDETHAVLPYDHRLKSLPDYLQQLEMESNGKSARLNNTRAPYPTCPIIWGEYGPNAQHAFYQLLHQGTRRVSVDFIAVVSNCHVPPIHQDLSRANCLAQARALMVGEQEQQAAVEGMTGHREYPGNKPSNTFLLAELTPRALGMMIAFYEHKVFTQSVIWNINPFDQWGVELGKTLAKEILSNEHSEELERLYDSSTSGLLEHCRKTLANKNR
ncbi:MAG: glucose-6-phosphate isomerase [Motiliproteus sp.]